MRISVEDDTLFSEISANKYALNIRFTLHDGGQRAKVIESDVDFELTFCNL